MYRPRDLFDAPRRPRRPRQPRRLRAAAALLLATTAALVASTAPTAPAGAANGDSAGTDFWIAFDRNFTDQAELTVFISGASATTGAVTPLGAAPIPFTVTPGTVTSVPLPRELQVMTEDGVEDKGIHITATAPVAVYGLNRIRATTDAFLALPTASAGTEFRVLAYSARIRGSGLGVVATEDGTTLTITPHIAIGAHPAGVPFTISLDQGQVYQVQSPGDTTGTTVSADHPVNVYGYDQCTNIPMMFIACDHVVEQLPATSFWGTNFLAARLATRLKGDTYRVLADRDGTVVTVNGAMVATLAAGEFYEAVLPDGATVAGNQGIQITTSQPALVAQYSNGSSFDDVVSDPFMMLIPPFEQYRDAYTVTTPASGFRANFVNVVIPTTAVASFRLDGASVDASAFAPVGATGFSSAQLPVELGSHTVSAASAFGVFVYGFDSFDSYGYPGGMLLSPVASAARLALDASAYQAPPGTPICAVATVSDAGLLPLPGIAVTFGLDAPTAGSQTVTTDGAGQARACFDSEVAGTGTLTAVAGLQLGTLSVTATVTFRGATTETMPPPSEPPPTEPTPPTSVPDLVPPDAGPAPDSAVEAATVTADPAVPVAASPQFTG